MSYHVFELYPATCLQLSQFSDTYVTSIEPKVRSGRAWTAVKALDDANLSDHECEAMRV